MEKCREGKAQYGTNEQTGTVKRTKTVQTN